MVSASLYELGEQFMMTVVRAFPPSDPCSSRVSLESRYGMSFDCRRYYTRSG